MALTPVEGFTNLSFQESDPVTTETDMLSFTSSHAGNTAVGYLPDTYQLGGDIWFRQGPVGPNKDFSYPAVGNYAHFIALHEIGHTLGIKHPHDIINSVDSVILPLDHDFQEYTVASYRSTQYTTQMYTTNEAYGYPQTFMMLDIAALQYLYGANYNFRNTDTYYSLNPLTGETYVNGIGQGQPGANRVFATIWDGGGTDTYDFSFYGADLQIDLNPGGFSRLGPDQRAWLNHDTQARGNIYNALLHEGNLASLIENAIGGAGSDTLTGNGISNRLSGQAGNDILTGGGGNDILIGGAGSNGAAFSGMKSDYVISQIDDGSYSVRDLRAGGDGEDLLTAIKFLRFADQTISLSPNKAPTSLSLSSLIAPEERLAGTVVGWLSGYDPDGDKLFYQLTSNSGNFFALQDNKLVLAKPLDYETKKSHTIGLRVSDMSGLGINKTVTISVKNVGDIYSWRLLEGTSGKDSLMGGSFNDKFYGGYGNDSLYGNVGKDSFFFNTKLSATQNVDRIRDFVVKDDTMFLENSIFRGIGTGTASKPGALNRAFFTIGPKAKDRDDYIIYDNVKGALYYDSDGSGEKQQIKFAALSPKLNLSAADFFAI